MLAFKKTVTLLSICVCAYSLLNAQATSDYKGLHYNGPDGIYTITTAVPFLRINPDARAGGMGDVGLATPVDVNAVYTNPAKLAFIKDVDAEDGKDKDLDYGFSVSFSPWLKSLVNDIYLASVNGYYKVKKQQTIAVSLRYFSLGSIQFTDGNGTNLNTFTPNEFAIDIHYSRMLSKYFSVAASLRFIYSNLASGASVGGVLVRPGIAGSGDLSWFYHKTFHENDERKMQHEFSMGMNVSNIGSKMSYTSSIVKDYLPANLGLGFGYTLDIDKHNSIGGYLDFNKLLVPSPFGAYDSVNQTFFYREQSSIKGIFTSFGDAPFIQQLRYINTGIGAEYFYNKQFGVRAGYFYESNTAGGRQFVTAGLTVKYKVSTLNFSYLIPTTIIRNPLDNTLRFSLVFNFSKGGPKNKENNSGISLVPDTPKKKGKKQQDDQQEQPATPQTQPQQAPPVDINPANPK